MLSAGIPPYRVADYLGHDLNVLLTIYSHILDTDRNDDMERMTRPVRQTSTYGQGAS